MSGDLAVVALDSASLLEKLYLDVQPSHDLGTRQRLFGELFVFNSWLNGRPISKSVVEEYLDSLSGGDYTAKSLRFVQRALLWWIGKIAELDPQGQPAQETIQENALIVAAQLAGLLNSGWTAQIHHGLVEKGQRLALMRVCGEEQSPAALRDKSMLAIALTTKIDASQIVRLSLFNVRLEAPSAVLALNTFHEKQRIIVLDPPATVALSNWLEFRGRNLGPLFYAIDHKGRVRWGHGISEQEYEEMLKKRSQSAGLVSLSLDSIPQFGLTPRKRKAEDLFGDSPGLDG